MIPLILVTVGTAVKYFVGKETEKEIKNGSDLAGSLINQKVYLWWRKTQIIMYLNIGFILLSCFLAWLFIPLSWGRILVCSVYASSALYGIYGFISGLIEHRYAIKRLKELNWNIKLFFQELLHGEIYNEVKKKYQEMAWYEKAMVTVFGENEKQVAHKITEQTMKIAWDKLVWDLIRIIFFYFIYILLFRILIVPFLIEETLEIGTLEALIYPFKYSLIYLWHLIF